MKKILIAFGVLVGVVIGALALAIGLASRDIPPPDFSDFAVERPELAADQNAYTSFMAASAALHWPDKSTSKFSDYVQGKPVDEATIVELLAKNREALELIERGLACKRCIAPEVLDPREESPSLTPWMQIGQLIAIKARHERLGGHWSEATDACISLLKFANLIQADSENLIYFLVAVSLEESGLNQARDLAWDNATPPEQLQKLSAALSALGPFSQGLARAFKSERNGSSYMLDQLAAGAPTLNDIAGISGMTRLPNWMLPRYLFQPNKTKLLSANRMREFISNAPLCYSEMKPIKPFEKPATGNWGFINQFLLRPNGVGEIFCSLCDTSLLIPAKKCQIECSIAGTRLLVACSAYRHQEGKLPPDLQALVPRYLPAVPADPYDGKPFRHSPSKGIVYSVGTDLKDGGGSTVVPSNVVNITNPSQKRWKAEDMVFELQNEAEQPAL